MKCKEFIPTFSLLSMMVANSLLAEAPNLQNNDISTVMQQMMKQYVGQGDVSQSTIQDSFFAFFDQFDPNRIYLLESDVSPFLDMNDAELSKVLAQYKNNDFSIYKKMNGVIEQSIVSARKLRKELERNPSLIIEDAKKNLDAGIQTHSANEFARNVDDLARRIRADMTNYVVDELVRFGENDVVEHPEKSLSLYESSQRSIENTYLFSDENNKPLPENQQKNLFATHVIKSLTSSLDSHTKFFDKTEAYDMKVRLEKGFEGIGIRLQQKIEGIFVTGLIPDGPAAKSGELRVNDQIVSVDGNPVEGKNFVDVLDELREESAPVISLGVKRGESLTQIKVKRDRVTLNEGRVETNYEKFGDGVIGEIILHMFYQGAGDVNSEEDVKKAIMDLKQKGNLKGLVLDLRDNGGGFLAQAVQVAGLFISKGVVVITKDGDGVQEVFRDTDGTQLYDGPLVVLTSKETASAAEIVAQTLQDYGVALVVGDKQTYGKGTVQSQNVSDDSADPEGGSPYKVTVGRYYTVSGKTPQLQGVKADIVVPSQFSFMPIGEAFTDHPLKADAIAPEYDDTLADVTDSEDKAELTQYYLPFVQKRVETWTNLLPELRKNSEKRIANNPDYQKFLAYLKQTSINEGSGAPDQNTPQAVFTDVQMAEAVNILKDMITLQPKKGVQSQRK